MTVADELIVAALMADPDKCLRLLRKHRPVDGWCRECGAPSSPKSPCRPFRLARLAAYRMERERDRRRVAP